jgi:hypothetical protein
MRWTAPRFRCRSATSKATECSSSGSGRDSTRSASRRPRVLSGSRLHHGLRHRHHQGSAGPRDIVVLCRRRQRREAARQGRRPVHAPLRGSGSAAAPVRRQSESGSASHLVVIARCGAGPVLGSRAFRESGGPSCWRGPGFIQRDPRVVQQLEDCRRFSLSTDFTHGPADGTQVLDLHLFVLARDDDAVRAGGKRVQRGRSSLANIGGS